MRLFVALDFPEAVKDQLSGLRADIPTARWVTRDQMHLTLFFIGETDRLAEVKSTLGEINVAPFEVSLTGVGRFPKGKHQPPRVLWAGVDGPPALNDLESQVKSRLTRLGFESDARPFHPHVTLARLKMRDNLPVMRKFMTDHRDFHAGPIAVESFTLYSSTLSPQGAVYTREAVYPLSP